MAEKIKSYGLKPFDSLFMTEQPLESVIKIPLEQMHYFKNHPFQVKNDEKMTETVESVKQHGILVPSLVRPDPNGGYEIVSGHRRHMACSLAGFTEMPAIVRELSDDEAILIMVDSNIQRENLLPSEKAWAYRMRLEAMKRQSGRPTINGGRIDHHLQGVKSRDILADETGESAKQIQRYIRLTYLLPELLAKVDDGTLSFSAAVDVSHLTESEQKMLLVVMERDECAPSGKQAKRLKEYSREGRLQPDVLDAVMTEEKPIATKIVLDGKKIQKFTPKGYTPKQMEEITLKLLENWYKKYQQKQQSER